MTRAKNTVTVSRTKILETLRNSKKKMEDEKAEHIAAQKKVFDEDAKHNKAKADRAKRNIMKHVNLYRDGKISEVELLNALNSKENSFAFINYTEDFKPERSAPVSSLLHRIDSIDKQIRIYEMATDETVVLSMYDDIVRYL